MANFRRHKPRTRTYHRPKWQNDPAWWAIIYDRRPARRRTTLTLGKLLRGEIDPDNTVWEVWNKPHTYYW